MAHAHNMMMTTIMISKTAPTETQMTAVRAVLLGGSSAVVTAFFVVLGVPFTAGFGIVVGAILVGAILVGAILVGAILVGVIVVGGKVVTMETLEKVTLTIAMGCESVSRAHLKFVVELNITGRLLQVFFSSGSVGGDMKTTLLGLR